ncbi:hypothetical protein AURDEDRAFT_171859 [Auricularia subglabra TFB-10046 SS5]|uniref:F-box domain-containing protein n=1 Tax=Auricularia subglabra (strain TFB-10046 / SS5) TaxID=717982 RepID=J0LIK8_AURST|nr:hypothetical protein AURDEDRAFT_171859 [Auricularia subglabra TFB-10046 SS5]
MSAMSSLQVYTRMSLGGFLQRHIHNLSPETIRRTFTHLSLRDLRHTAQVCARWRELAFGLIALRPKEAGIYKLPWNVLRRVFELLDPLNLGSAARVRVRWRTIALSFFSYRMGRRHIHDLAAETIKYAFAFLEFDDLRYAAQVCVRWRDLGIEHPGFWRDIELRSASHGALELLAARHGQCAGRLCNLTVDIEGQQRLIERTLIPLMAAFMPSVKTLTVRLDALYQLPVWDVLNHPAPHLVTFSLKLYSPDRLMPKNPVRTHIFEDHIGCLQEVHLIDVMLPFPIDAIPAFHDIWNMSIMHAQGMYEPFPDFLFECCPRLKWLTLHSGTLDCSSITNTGRQGISRLEILDVDLHPDSLADFVANAPIADVPVVVLTTPPDDNAAYDFLKPVTAPFNVGFVQKSSNEFWIVVEADWNGYRRVFAEYPSDYTVPPEHNYKTNILLENDAFPDQVNFIKISHTLWDLLTPYLTLYTTVRRLIVRLDTERTTCALPTRIFPYAGLQTLVIEAEAHHIYVDSADVVDFIDNVLQAPGCRALELHRVFLEGNRGLVTQRFDSVAYADRGHCREIIRNKRSIAT